MLKAVIDTNVLVSSFFGGNPREVLDLWRDGQIVLCLSDEIVAEYLEVMARFGEARQEAGEFFAMLGDRPNVLLVTPRHSIHEIAADPDDDKFLECAVAARADVIITGDSHLLSLRKFRGIPALDPAAFLTRFANGESQSESDS